MLSTIRKKLKGHEKITGKAERSDYRRTLWAIAAVEVMSEMEGSDYGTDKIFLELKIPSFDRNWAVRYLRPRRAHSAMGAEDTRREVLKIPWRDQADQKLLMPQSQPQETIPS